MAVPDVTPSSQYFGNNSTVNPYVVGFRFDDNSWLRVQVTDVAGVVTDLQLGTDFSISGSGLLSQASITTSQEVPGDSIVQIYRDTPETNETDLPYTGRISSTILESMLDKIVMMIQDLKFGVTSFFSRALRVPAGENVDPLPSATDRAGKVVYFNEDGIPVVLTPSGVVALSGGVPNGIGIPPGGLISEVLTKASSVDGDVFWGPKPSNNNVIPPGPFSDDEEAYRDGIRFGQLYRDDTGAPKLRGLVAIGKVAFLGDSQTAFGSWSPSPSFPPGTAGNSYWPWFSALAGGAFELVPDSSTGSLVFATGGLRSDQFATHVANVIASTADYVPVMVGTNDVLAGYPSATTVDNIMNLICAPILGANKIPIVVALYPMPLGTPGNASGQLSSKILEIRDGLSVACAEASVPYYDANSVIEDAPGVGNSSLFATPSDVHLDPVGCIIFARELLAKLRMDLSFGFNPLSNTNWITSNADFSSGATTPTGYFRVPSPPAALSSESVVTIGSDKWWQFTLTPSGGSASITLGNSAPNTESPAGLEVDVICLIEVVSGAVRFGTLAFQDNTSTNVVWALSDFNVKKAYITPGDGPIFVSPQTTGTVAGGITNVRPILSFAVEEVTTVRVRLLTGRKYP